MRAMLGKVLCYLGFHDFDVVDVTLGFGPAGGVETVECRRCGHRTTRAAK